MSAEQQLQALRERIDALDEQIQALLNERARCALEVAEVKQASGGEIAYYRPEREAQILRRIKSRNTGPLSSTAIARLFREIISACMALEQTLNIAILDPKDPLTQAAALKHFGHSVQTLTLDTLAQVFTAVEDGRADFGLVHIHHASDGFVSHSLDMFLQSELLLCGEVVVPLVRQTATNVPGDHRFLVIGKQHIAPSGHDKTVVLVSADNRPGLLHELLEPLARYEINMIRIESRPAPDSGWDTVFFIELDGHRDDDRVRRALSELQQQATLFKILGSFPSTVL